MKVIFPTGRFISPGFHMIHTVEVEAVEVWYMGHLVEEKEVETFKEHGVHVPEPDEGFRGTFYFGDHAFKIVRDDDTDFWDGVTKAEWLKELKERNRDGILAGAERGWWSVDSEGNPRKPGLEISIRDMQSQNKHLMAHLMVDLGFFPSVGQARKNGWDKPLELGTHELGPRKKRITVEIVD